MSVQSERRKGKRRLRTRSRTHSRWFVAVCAPAISAAGCAELLGLPDDPQLTRPAAPEPAPTSPSGTASIDGSSDGDGSSSDPPRPRSAAAGNASMQPQGDLDPVPAERAEPDDRGSVDAPTLQAPADAGSSPSGPVAADAAAIEPAPACGGGSVEGPNANCYAVGGRELTWLDARAACRERGAGWDLAAVHDAETDRFLAAQFSGEAWLGGSDANVEGTWRWVRDGVTFWRGDATGAPVNGAFDNWNEDEPNGDDSSDCVRMVAATTRWADLECEELRRALCEGPKS
jgi:hypothetical protein